MPNLKQIIGKATLAATLVVSTLSAGTEAHATEPFLGEIRTFGFNFCPRGWTAAEGQLLAINQNTALFSLFGTIYGGDGRTTFALPDLRGRFVMHLGTGPGLSPHDIGQRSGTESETLTQSQMPAHTHDVLVTQSNDQGDNGGLKVEQASETGMASGGTASVGGDQPHNNMPPYLVMNTCVALQGIYPSRS
ncbi:tail fiber protein [uncultured Shimia sp.]|uniref:phage tail protein n=1 Tax=uncultured Shimia sp. TaxID=573152 RepID=UPI00262F7874|nr:tail fiber protein [uncultured Shimia sp.]